MADWGPCCSLPFLPLQWLSSSLASTAAALIAGLACAGRSVPCHCFSMKGCHRKALVTGSFASAKLPV
eukprot:1161531-Pelagomonas_calceolata.AAC.13